MPERSVRFDKTFFDELDQLLGSERGSFGAPSSHDFLLLELPSVRDRLAADFETCTLEVDPGSPVRIAMMNGIFCRSIVLYCMLVGEHVHVTGVSVDLWPLAED